MFPTIPPPSPSRAADRGRRADAAPKAPSPTSASRSGRAKCSASPALSGRGAPSSCARSQARIRSPPAGQGQRRSPPARSGPRDALDHGVVLVPEDRKAQGLILPQTIAENLALGNYPRVAPSGWITSARTQDFRRERHLAISDQGDADRCSSASFRAETSRRWSSPRASCASRRSSSSTSRRAASTSARAPRFTTSSPISRAAAWQSSSSAPTSTRCWASPTASWC